MLALIIVSSFLVAYFDYLVFYPIIALVLVPIFLPFDAWFRKRLLPRGKPNGEIALKLQQLKVRWIIRRKGRGIRGWKRVELGLPRTIADSSLEEQLSNLTIPNGLIEPEQIRTSKPGSLLGCIVGVSFSLFIIWAMFLAAGTPFPAMAIFWGVIFLFLLNILRLILGLPIVHRSRKLPAFLRSIGRGRLLSRPIVVGPGWVKFGDTVWRGDRDMFFIRRTGFRLASSEIDCMFAGPEKRSRMTFSGVSDDDFQLLFGAWNVDEVRMEFVDSELS
jgi:membrane protein implicated in regulation of membrane protease activity